MGTARRILDIADAVAETIDDGLEAVAGVITGATNASPIVITDAGHGLETGEQIVIAAVEGNTAANGTWYVTVVNSSTFSLDDSTGNGVYTTGGTWALPTVGIERVYGEQYANTDLVDLKIDVRPLSISTGEESRGGDEDVVEIEIALQKAITPSDTVSIDALAILARRVSRLFPIVSVLDTDDIDPTEGVQVLGNVQQVYSPEKLSQRRFYSVINLTLREFTSR
jgi:hypothetical protein